MKIILERNLDFKQFQNLIALTFVTGMMFLGMVNSVDFKSYYSFEIILFFLTAIFISILFTKKGLFIENHKLYNVVFLFGFKLRKTLIEISDFQQLFVTQGNLSTNYAYTYNIKALRNWEPDLNYSIRCFNIFTADENKTNKKKILTLTKPEKVKLAIDFIVKNTKLNY
ncbi:hypothetical protein NJT12_10410 [Flavobacterium sp. AC]|uniref:PH domain-containing protein n=1 Tax=Flavobacterium azizsancarii TaxID=2961580 RepID=A0ABT4WD28_9FLAO|nr:hypothetical protein [Flavobacterium azizsancarii]MDA6070029.1 hypothetical protein [Flavobacterium azizsancarii]